jgi:hypothetical protein
LRDVGGWVACLVAPGVLRFWLNRGEPPERRTSLTQFRQEVRQGPADSGDIEGANAARAIALQFASVVMVLLFAAATFVRRGVPSLGVLSDVVEAVLLSGGLFASGASIASGARWTLSSILANRVDAAFDRTPQGKRPRGLAVWLCMPSNLDLCFSLIWAAGFTSAILDPAV